MKTTAMLIGLGLFLGAAACGPSAPATPDGAAKAIVENAKAGKWGEVYDAMAPELQHKQYIFLRVVHGAEKGGGKFSISADELGDAAGMRAAFVKLAPDLEMFTDGYTTLVIGAATVQGDKAEIAATRKSGDEQEKVRLVMQKIDGVWKMTALEGVEKEETGKEENP